MVGTFMRVQLLFPLLLGLLLSIPVRATHISGGEIYYHCLGGNQYEITLVVFRDCAGIALNNSYQLDVQSPCGNQTMTVTTPGGTEISQLCDLEMPNSTCNGGTLPGIQQYIYTGTVTLPPCDSWTIFWTQPYRNDAIANLVNPGNKNVYVAAYLNNADTPCNDSPQFTNTPIPYVCAGYPVSYSYGGFDPEADSLTYTFVSAMNANGNPLAYQPGFSGLQPITGITLDSISGQVNFTLNTVGNWVVVVRVDQYAADGTWIGAVMRDMQFIAYPCSNVPPTPSSGTISNIGGDAEQTGPRSIRVCESGDFCFDAVITDPNAGDTLSITNNLQQSLPGATISYSGTNPVTCHICWAASAGDAGFYPFILNANDGACPIPSEQAYVFSIRVLPGILLAAPSTTPESCDGAGDGTASVQVNVGTAPFHYQWSTGDTTAGITAGAGSYQVVVSDQLGCVNGPVNVVIGPGGQPAIALAGADLTGCINHFPLQLNGSVQNAATGSWSGGGSFTGSGLNPLYTPSAAEIASGGADLVLTTSANSCGIGTDTLHIQIPNSFDGAAISAQDMPCAASNTGTATFSPAGPGFTYLWDDPFSVQTGPTASGLAAGSYSVHVTDPHGCDTTLSTAIQAPAPLSITGLSVVNETCAGLLDGSMTANVTGGTPPYHYSWSNGDTTASIQVGAGSYSVSVTDANGCTPAIGSATVMAGGQLNQAFAGADLLGCFNELPVELNGSVINATGGNWSGGSGTLSGGMLGTYMPSSAELAAHGVDLVLTTSGNAACPPATDTLHITFPMSFLGNSLNVQAALCQGEATGSAQFQPAGPGFTYLWNDPAAQTTPLASGLAAGAYTVHVTDTYGCDTVATALVGEPQALLVSITTTDPACANTPSGLAATTVSGGTPGYVFQWSPNAAGQTSSTASGLLAGTYSVDVTDSHGCTAQASTTVQAPPPIVITAQAPDTVCVNVPATLTAQASGGTGTLNIVWSGIGSGPSVQHAFAASQNVHVTVTDQAGCSGPSLSLPITVLDLSLASLLTYGDTAFCPGGTAVVGAALAGYPGAFTITWPELATSGPGPFSFICDQDSLLHVEVTDICANTLQAIIPIQVEVPPTIILPDTIAAGCAPLTAHFPAGLANVPVNWLWQFGDGSTSTAMTPVHVYNAGDYTVSVTVTTPLGCTATSINTGMVQAYASPHADFSADPWHTDADHPDVQFSDLSQGDPVAWQWEFGDGADNNGQNPLHTFTSTGIFQVHLTVTDAHGCIGDAGHEVVVDPIYDITIPNVFSPDPNNPGGLYDPNALNNDVFYPFIRFVKDYRMRVFNRWGELVFESNDILRGWDGRYRGHLGQQDVYAYQIWVRFTDGKEVERLGDLTLLR
jgi:PKD repeat protein